MHSLKILPLSPPSPRCPAIVVRHIGLWFLATPPTVPILVLQPRIPRRLSVLRCLAPPAASAPCAVSLPSQFPHPARRYRGSCVMAGARNVQRSFVGVV